MKKLLLISAFALSLPITSFAAPSKSNTTMAVNYENPQQLINNYYAAQEFCRSSTKENDPETTIMCNYRDAADTKLNQLGYCFGDNDEQSNAEREWKKCSQRSKTTKNTVTTTTQATMVPASVINASIQDVKKICQQKGLETFEILSQQIQQCFVTSNNSSEKLQKCMLDDLSLIYFYDQLLTMIQQSTGKRPNATLPFLSGEAILARQQQYYIPNFGSLENAAMYFKIGIDPVTDQLAQCANKNWIK